GAAVLEVARRRAGGLGVILDRVILARGGRQQLEPLGRGRRGRAGGAFERARRRGGVAGRGGGLAEHPRHEIRLVRRLLGHRLRRARLHQRFLAPALLEEVDRRLQRLADLGPHGLALFLRERRPQGNEQDEKQRAHHRMNCSGPMMPTLVRPRRCAEASTMATLRYFTSLFGRRCSSGWSVCAAARRSRASSSGRPPASVSPFQMSVPSKSMSICTTSGGVVGGGGLPTGMFSFTACVWIGMVMISMMRSTSITSMSGVVLMSTITSASRAPPPSDMAMLR